MFSNKKTRPYTNWDGSIRKADSSELNFEIKKRLKRKNQTIKKYNDIVDRITQEELFTWAHQAAPGKRF